MDVALVSPRARSDQSRERASSLEGSMTKANETIFMRAITSGTVQARARALHRGSSSWVWDVEMRDDEERLCATSRLIIAVRDPR